MKIGLSTSVIQRGKTGVAQYVFALLRAFLPRFALADTAGEHDNLRVHEVCAGVQVGEIVIFDRAYVDFAHLADLSMREVLWVTRAKENLQYRVVRRFQPGPDGNLLRDDLIQLTGPAGQAYPVELRRVVALVEVAGQLREMVFLTNNLTWSAQTICDLYRCRRSIEVFFKELKQTLQLADFLGHNANAVRWQVWTALLVYLLLRFCAFLSQWGLASPASLRWCARRYGRNWICPASSTAMGQPIRISLTLWPNL